MDYQWIESTLTATTGEMASFHICEKPHHTLFVTREWRNESHAYEWNWRVIEELKSTSILKKSGFHAGVLLEAMEQCQKAYEGLTTIPA